MQEAASHLDLQQHQGVAAVAPDPPPLYIQALLRNLFQMLNDDQFSYEVEIERQRRFRSNAEKKKKPPAATIDKEKSNNSTQKKRAAAAAAAGPVAVAHADNNNTLVLPRRKRQKKSNNMSNKDDSSFPSVFAHAGTRTNTATNSEEPTLELDGIRLPAELIQDDPSSSAAAAAGMTTQNDSAAVAATADSTPTTATTATAAVQDDDDDDDNDESQMPHSSTTTMMARPMRKRQALSMHKWNEKFRKLEAFKAEFSHVNVPNGDKKYESLKFWVNKQKTQWKKFLKGEQTHLLQEQVDRLIGIGMGTVDEGPYTKSSEWDLRYNELCAFQSQHGHCNVCLTAHRESHAKLAGWVQVQKIYFRNREKGLKTYILTDDQMVNLARIGFKFPAKFCGFTERYAQILEFKARFGHTRVPQNFKESNNLGSWVEYIRRFYHSGRMPADRIKKLEAIGFEWRAKNKDGSERQRPKRKKSNDDSTPPDL